MKAKYVGYTIEFDPIQRSLGGYLWRHTTLPSIVEDLSLLNYAGLFESDHKLTLF